MISKGILGNTLTAVITLLSSFLLSGCFTLFTVPAEDFKNNVNHGRVEITLKNDDKISVPEGQPIFFYPTKKMLMVHNNSLVSKIELENIKEIKEEKFNFQKTFFSSLWLGAIGLFVLGLLLYAAAPILIGP